MPREASPSSTARAWAPVIRQSRAAAAALNGLIGSSATRPASCSVYRTRRMLNSRSVGGAPWGKRLSRSDRS
jgi:hypothetical protein